MAGLTLDQQTFLRELVRFGGGWVYQSIDRSGCRKRLASARQQCRRKGFAESHPCIRRQWRITHAGRAALSQGNGDG